MALPREHSALVVAVRCHLRSAIGSRRVVVTQNSRVWRSGHAR